MYPRNSPYFPSQVPPNAQLSSTFMQQQLPSGYSLTSSVVSQLQQQQQQQQQQLTLQRSSRYSSSSNPLNTLIGQSKISSTPQVDNSHLQNLPSQSAWLLNGSHPIQQSSNQSWQRRSENQATLCQEQINFNLSSDQAKNLSSPHAMSTSAMKYFQYRSDGIGQTHHPQVSNSTQTFQQSLSSRVIPQSRTSRLQTPTSISPNVHPGNLNQYNQMQRHLLNHSSLTNNSTQNVMHSPPNLSNRELGLGLLGHTALQTLQHSMHSGTASKPSLHQPEKRDRIHIRFDQKKTNHQAAPLLQNRLSKQSVDEDDNKEDEPQIKTKPPLVLENNVRIVIDDDIEIVGTKEAEIMSHIRSDCPIHRYERVERVDIPPNPANQKCCSKCFCYICDKLAEKCDKWNDSFSPHCNANTKSSCWKARRNIKKSALITCLAKEELTPEISRAGDMSIKYTIKVREAYITYRNGIPCEFHLVPCECSCHRTNKYSKDVCAQCKAVHDMKKKFNYESVRTVILETIIEIQQKYSNDVYGALVLYEALLSELCSHRPADFNHVTRMPSNPDPRCQCNTPQIMEEHIEWDLIKIFVLNEIKPTFKEKFIKCIKASIQPLQLKDILKKFFEMRHWDDVVLQDVLRGNTGGRYKNAILKEDPLFIELRVKKLTKDQKFMEIVQYLKHVKNSKPSKNTISDGTSLPLAVDRWILESLIKDGQFQEASFRLFDAINTMPTLPVNYVLGIFSLMTGKGIPDGTKLKTTFNHSVPPRYELVEKDRTVLLLIYLNFLEVSRIAQLDFKYYLWLADWLNKEKMEHNQNETAKWMQTGNDFLEWSRKIASNNFTQSLKHCPVIVPQVTLFICSRLFIQFMNKNPGNMSYITEVINAYKKNEWGLFYMFSQPNLLSCGNHHLITWLTNFMKSTSVSLCQFSVEAFTILIKNHNFNDVCLFMQQWVSPTWVNHPSSFIQYFLDICFKFSLKVLDEISKNSFLQSAEFLCGSVLEKLIEWKLHREINLFPYCEVIGRACCYINMNEIPEYKKIFLVHDSTFSGKSMTDCYKNNLVDIFSFYQQKFQKNILKPKEIATLLRYSIHEGNTAYIKLVFTCYFDKHECPEQDTATSMVMNEVADLLNTPHDNYIIKKDDVISLYSRLLSHEALNWLICAKCSSKMPEKWMEIWKALAKNGMMNKLTQIVNITLHQFTLWMKELCVQEKSDIDRLLRCLNVFITNIATTLIKHCSFNFDGLQRTILQTADSIANPQLQQDYLQIIRNVFQTLLMQQRTTNSKVIERQTNVTNELQLPVTVNQQTQISRSKSVTVVNDVSTPSTKPEAIPVQEKHTATPSKQLTIANTDQTNSSHPTVPVNPPKLPNNNLPRPQISNPSKPQTNNIPSSEQSKPISKSSTQTSLKLTINKSRLSTSSEMTPSTADKNLSSPPFNSPTTSCPQCGDPMTSSFRCSKCQTRKSVDVCCPNCNQVNQDLKGYSCRFCYTSLLEVLFTGESKSTEKPPVVEKSGGEKKRRKLKRKMESTKNLSPKSSESSTFQPSTSETEEKLSKKVSAKIGESVENAKNNRPHIKTLLHKDKNDHFSVKSPPTNTELSKTLSRSSKSQELSIASTASPTPIKTFHRPVISKISVNDLIPQPPKPHQRAKEAQQKERPHTKKLTIPLKQDSYSYSRIKETSTLSESDSDSSDDEHQVPPLLLRRKSEHETASPIPEKKPVQNEPIHTSPIKRAANQGTFMSKKQKTILNRMKQVGRNKPIIKQAKNSAKNQQQSSTEWEVSKRRKPGPKSKTSFYKLNPSWGVPRYIKIPYTLDMQKVCFVHLSHFPLHFMQKIRDHQPELNLKSLYA